MKAENLTPPKYFCCSLINAGIGDQFFQFSQLYNLGKSLGLEYVYLKFPPNQWSPDFDFWKFFGIDYGEKNIDDFLNYERIPVDSYEATRVLAEERSLFTILPTRRSELALIQLNFSPKLYTSNPERIKVPLRFTLRPKIRLTDHNSPELSLETSSSPLICLHIRRGDCTWVKYRERYVFLGMRKIAKNDSDLDVRRAPATEHYLQLLDTALVCSGQQAFRIRVYSDGPCNVFEMSTSLLARLSTRIIIKFPSLLTTHRIILRSLRRFYNPMSLPEIQAEWKAMRESLQEFSRFPELVLRVGTSPELTGETILAFYKANIAIVRSDRGFPLFASADSEKQCVLSVLDPLETNKIRLAKYIRENYS
ncbi:hypothetical protein [Candidatus Methylobacter favarea]|nr:hypothetical protein [Candidatus Methylobacter favarea]